MGYIALNHVSKKIGKNEVLHDICLDLEKNKIYGIQGINGSCLLYTSTNGKIFFIIITLYSIIVTSV